MNILGILVLNSVFNYAVYKFYLYKMEKEKDDKISELQCKIGTLEKQLLEKNDFIAKELQSEFNNEIIIE